MRTRAVLAVAASLLVAAFFTAAYAGTSAVSVSMAGLRDVTVTVTGTTDAIVATDGGTSATKRAGVVSCVVSGQAVVILWRLQRAGNGTFVDLVVSDTAANLDTDTGSMDLSTDVPAHPSPAEDAVDTAVILAAQ